MLRELQTIMRKNVDAMFKAGEAMKTGQPVVKVFSNTTTDGTVTVAEDDTTSFFFVTKERIPTGVNAGRVYMSDYDDNFVNIAEGEMVKLIKPLAGERYAVDSFAASGLVKGDKLAIADGSFAKTTSASRLIYGGEFNDAGHALSIIEITD